MSARVTSTMRWGKLIAPACPLLNSSVTEVSIGAQFGSLHATSRR